MSVRINGKDEVAWTIEQLIKVTKENIEAATISNNKMVKLTNWIFWLTLVIGIFTAIQILPYFKFAKEIAQYTLNLWKTILLVGLASAFTGLVFMVQSKFSKDGGESVGGPARPWWLRIGWALTIGGFALQVLGTLMAPQPSIKRMSKNKCHILAPESNTLISLVRRNIIIKSSTYIGKYLLGLRVNVQPNPARKR